MGICPLWPLLQHVAIYLLAGEHPMELIKLFSTGLIAWFTVQISFRRFTREKRWEKASTAYDNLIGVLHELKRTNLIWLAEAEKEEYVGPLIKRGEKEQQIYETQQKEVREDHLRARRSLEKYLDLGLYYLSEEAVAALEALRAIRQECVSDWECGAEMLADLYAREQKAIEACLNAMRTIAIRETGRP